MVDGTGGECIKDPRLIRVAAASAVAGWRVRLGARYGLDDLPPIRIAGVLAPLQAHRQLWTSVTGGEAGQDQDRADRRRGELATIATDGMVQVNGFEIAVITQLNQRGEQADLFARHAGQAFIKPLAQLGAPTRFAGFAGLRRRAVPVRSCG